MWILLWVYPLGIEDGDDLLSLRESPLPLLGKYQIVPKTNLKGTSRTID
jgi:hypothetical protein